MKIDRLDKNNYCLYCRTKISIQKAFCSNECKDIHFENLKIQIPKPFTRRLAQHFKSKHMIEKECKKFATIHKYDEKLTKEKIFRILEEEHQIKFGLIKKNGV